MRIKSYSPAWYIIAAGVMLALLIGCSEPTEPVGMQPFTEAEFMANMKANGFNYSTNLGPCAPGGAQHQVAQVNVCFTQLFRALGFTGAAIGTCAAAAGGSATAAAAIGAWSVCGLSVYGAGDAWGNYVERTQIGDWANQSAEEIANRMRQVIYERMVRRGIWSENAGCC